MQNKTAAAASGRSAAIRSMVRIPEQTVGDAAIGDRCDAADCSGR